MCANIRPTSLIRPSEIEINIPPPMGQDTCIYVYVPRQIQIEAPRLEFGGRGRSRTHIFTAIFISHLR